LRNNPFLTFERISSSVTSIFSKAGGRTRGVGSWEAIDQQRRGKMKVSKSSLVIAAAFAGLLGGTVARVNAEPLGTTGGVGGNGGNKATKSTKASKMEKHACAGKNSCSGKGGCKTGDNGCKAKNSCKGKGGCATDGSKKSS
jgi:hypothetical protein